MADQMSRWADEIDDEDYETTTTAVPAREEVSAKDGEKVVVEIRVDPDTGKKQKVLKTLRTEKKLVSKKTS